MGVKAMEKLIIRGGHCLNGKVNVSGAKNAVLKLMAASIMASETCVIHNVPKIADVITMIGVLKGLGIDVEYASGTLTIDPRGLNTYEAPRDYVREMRASIQVVGPLLSKLGKARVYQPGGCEIGSRPINYHLNGFKSLGAKIQDGQGFIQVEGERLEGKEIYLDFPSVGATENIMAAAVMAEGTTIIRNAAKEPELIEEQNYLNQMGACIRGAGSDIIRIDGVKKLRSAEYTVTPDRIEAGTLMVAALMCKGQVFIENVTCEHVEPIIGRLVECGADIVKYEKGVFIKGNRPIMPLTIQTLPYPGFPTDMQPQMVALLTLADGASMITENIFNSRFKHVDELRRMGADLKVEGRTVMIRGVPGLSGAQVKASDLRGGAALVIAGLVAEGVTEVEGIHHILRGYENFAAKLRGLGANIQTVKILHNGERQQEKVNVS